MKLRLTTELSDIQVNRDHEIANVQGQTQKQQGTFTPNPTYIVGWGVVPGPYCSLDRETEMADAWKTCHALPPWWFRTISRLFIKMEARRKWHNIFQVLKEKNCQPRILQPEKTSFKNERTEAIRNTPILVTTLLQPDERLQLIPTWSKRIIQSSPVQISDPQDCEQIKHLFWKTNEKMNEWKDRDFPGGPLVKNLPWNTGDMGSLADWGTKIPHASGQLSPPTAIKSSHA